MKKFGMPALLSAGYFCMLYLVFSSDFAKTNTFFLPEKAPVVAKPVEEKISAEMPNMSARKSMLVDMQLQALTDEGPASLPSPESPAKGH